MIIAMLVGMACGVAPTSTDTSDSSGCSGEGEGESSVAVTWTTTGFNVAIANGSGDYTLGVAETDPSISDPWTGEDCLNGETLADGTVYRYCHALSSTGGSAITGTLSDLEADDDGSGTLSEYTLFSSEFETRLTYVLYAGDGSCSTFGADTSYYLCSLDCTDLN